MRAKMFRGFHRRMQRRTYIPALYTVAIFPVLFCIPDASVLDVFQSYLWHCDIRLAPILFIFAFLCCQLLPPMKNHILLCSSCWCFEISGLPGCCPFLSIFLTGSYHSWRASSERFIDIIFKIPFYVASQRMLLNVHSLQWSVWSRINLNVSLLELIPFSALNMTGDLASKISLFGLMLGVLDTPLS